MSKLVFKLASVSEEEADGVRKALETIGVEFYETPAGSWGWSLPAIWVKHDDDFFAARKEIDNFQESYLRNMKESGSPVSKRSIWKIGLALILCAIVLYVFNSFWLHQWI
jgi:hypothetical protein